MSFQWSSTNSMNWRKHCWKNVIRYCRTPHQEKYRNGNLSCWRKYGSREANHFHIFWGCPKPNLYWRDIHKTLNTVFKGQLPLNFETLFLGQAMFLNRRGDIKLLQALLAASKKAITRKWFNPAPPTLEEWFGIVLKIFKMEKLTYCLRIQKDKFQQSWIQWIDFVTPIRADFI